MKRDTMNQILPTIRQHPRERGSALLIVFLFAAIIAISLYMEMPSVAFEAKRAREQLLVDRGSEYAHAVKLYYRKFRAYPATIDALENTNRMRFLRHKFKDPLTGDDKWRLLHAGPGGQLTDSKVNPIGLTANGQTSGIGSNTFGSSTTAAALTTTPAADAGNGATPTAPPVPQRPPEMPVNGGGAPTMANTDPTQSLLPGAPAPVQTNQLSNNGGNPANPMPGLQPLIGNPNPLPTPGSLASSTPQTTTAAGAGSASGATATGAGAATTTTAQSGAGVLRSGGIAGVASLGKGSSIKTINDQNDYSLWEFYYDPTKDTSAVAGQSGVNPMNGVTQPNNSLAPNSTTPNSSSPANSSTTTTGTTPATTPSPNPPQQP